MTINRTFIQKKYLNPVDRDQIELQIARGDMLQARQGQMLLDVIDDLATEISEFNETPQHDCTGCFLVEEYQALIAELRAKLQAYDLWLSDAPKSFL